MSIERAIAQIDNRTQEVPSNWHAGKGLSDGVTWHEVREWLSAILSEGMDPGCKQMMEVWKSAYRLGVADERTSASSAGIAGCFCNTAPCKCVVEPARNNPHG